MRGVQLPLLAAKPFLHTILKLHFCNTASEQRSVMHYQCVDPESCNLVLVPLRLLFVIIEAPVILLRNTHNEFKKQSSQVNTRVMLLCQLVFTRDMGMFANYTSLC